MKYCQSPRCHHYSTSDRLKGSEGNKTYQTRKRSKLYFGMGNFCTLCFCRWVQKRTKINKRYRAKRIFLNTLANLHRPCQSD